MFTHRLFLFILCILWCSYHQADHNVHRPSTLLIDPFLRAAAQGNVTELKLLAQQGVDTNTIEQAYALAASEGHVETMQHLYELQKAIGIVLPRTNAQALQEAINNKRMQAVEFILSRPFTERPSLPTINELLDIEPLHDESKAKNLLHRWGACIEHEPGVCLHTYIQHGTLQVVANILSGLLQNPPSNIADILQSLLKSASYAGQTQIVVYLCEALPHYYQPTLDSALDDALIVAATNKKWETAQYLLRRGANIQVLQKNQQYLVLHPPAQVH